MCYIHRVKIDPARNVTFDVYPIVVRGRNREEGNMPVHGAPRPFPLANERCKSRSWSISLTVRSREIDDLGLHIGARVGRAALGTKHVSRAST